MKENKGRELAERGDRSCSFSIDRKAIYAEGNFSQPFLETFWLRNIRFSAQMKMKIDAGRQSSYESVEDILLLVE